MNESVLASTDQSGHNDSDNGIPFTFLRAFL